MKLYKQITCIALFCSAAFSLGAQSTHMELSLEDGEGLYTADLISRDLSGEEIYSLTVKWVPAPEDIYLERR